MLRKTKQIHFTAIGGIGMSGIAEILLNLGYQVTGSDLESSPITQRLEQLGAKIYIGHQAENLTDADVLVYSSAVAESNPELQAARARGVSIIRRAEMLSELMRLKYGVAVAGTHGKTTTSSMVAVLLQHGGIDPTAVIGGRLNYLGSNAKLGQGEYFVAEADESDGSFLQLPPTLAVVTNIDNDHLDHYGNMENLKQAFLDFINRVPFYGLAILCGDDRNVRQLLPRIVRKYWTYGIEREANLMAVDIVTEGLSSRFTVAHNGERCGEVRLQVPGKYNINNSLAAIGVALELGIPFKLIREAMEMFDGVQRRFQVRGQVGGVTVIDDYGHHPSEIAATLTGAREGWKGPLWVIFQPHRYTRTAELYRDFGTCFSKTDRIFLLDIYAAGEEPIEGISSALIADQLRQAGRDVTIATRESVAAQVDKEVMPGTMVITLGAGDVYRCGEELLYLLRSRQAQKSG